jgi:protoheme ferro-lyase
MNFSKGLLLVQLGSPEALTLQKIGEYLYDFLGDPHTL